MRPRRRPGPPPARRGRDQARRRRVRATSASIAAPTSSARLESHSHVSMTMTAANEPQLLLYEPKLETYQANPPDAASHTATAVTDPAETTRQRQSCMSGPNR